MPILITTSRTRPRDSPSGPNTAIPASRAAYTLFTDAMTTKSRSLRVANDDRPGYRPRRTCLSVPGSNLTMIEKAKGLPADEVFLDLEDAVAPDAKAQARTQVAAALADPDAQPMTDEELDSLVPYKVYLRGRPKLANKKQLVSVRYSPEVLQWFRATGPGWQARMDEALKAHIARKPKLD